MEFEHLHNQNDLLHGDEVGNKLWCSYLILKLLLHKRISLKETSFYSFVFLETIGDSVKPLITPFIARFIYDDTGFN